MKIKVFKARGWRRDDEWRAEPVLPGTPPIGTGRTPAEAIGDLLICIEAERETWGKYGWTVSIEIEQ